LEAAKEVEREKELDGRIERLMQIDFSSKAKADLNFG
jgi:hypothetical protein